MLLIEWGIISGLLSFISSYSATSEILRYRYNNRNFNNDNSFNTNYNLKYDSKQKVHFSNCVKICDIPSRKTFNRKKIEELWYQDSDFKEFLRDFVNDKMKN